MLLLIPIERETESCTDDDATIIINDDDDVDD